MPPRHHSSPAQPAWLRQPSWWIVIVAGALVIFFLVAIGRELVQGYRVRQQVGRLQQSVTTEEQRQTELNDLLSYLASPTFQERQARLNLGLKKSGERVVIVPTTPADEAGSGGQSVEPVSAGPSQWWQYFFGARANTLST